MDRALPRPLEIPRRFWIYGLALLFTIPNILIFRFALGTFQLEHHHIFDWWLMEEAVERIGTGTMYAWSAGEPHDYTYRYAPLLTYVMAPLVVLGLEVWRLLHVAALLLLPKWLAAVTLVAAPFWFDVAHGNFVTFAFVFGYLALQGSRWATVAYIVLALLVPRPLMLPLIAWILWKRPEWRLPTAGIVAVYSVLTLATGEGFTFLASLRDAGDMLAYDFNWGASRFIGLWWMLIGIPLGVWLTIKGRVGLAGLAVSPYLIPYYLLVLLWELRHAAFLRK